MGNYNVIVIDFETTGLSPHYGDRTIEVGAVLISNNQIVDRFQSLMNPEMSNDREFLLCEAVPVNRRLILLANIGNGFYSCHQDRDSLLACRVCQEMTRQGIEE